MENYRECYYCGFRKYDCYNVKIDNINVCYLCPDHIRVWINNHKLWGWKPEIYLYKNKEWHPLTQLQIAIR